MEDLVVAGFEKFSEYLLPFADRFIIIGGTAVTMLKADGDQVLSRIVRTTKDIDLLVVMERVDQPFIDALRSCNGEL